MGSELCLDCAVVDGTCAAGLLGTGGAAGDEGGSDDCFAIRVGLNDLIHLSEMMSLRFIAFHPIDRLDLPALRVNIL